MENHLYTAFHVLKLHLKNEAQSPNLFRSFCKIVLVIVARQICVNKDLCQIPWIPDLHPKHKPFILLRISMHITDTEVPGVRHSS